MLKRFFISMLGSMAGLWISIFILFFVGIFAIASLIGKSSLDSAIDVKPHSILHFSLAGTIDDRYQPTNVMDFVINGKTNSLSLDDMLKSLKVAAKDNSIDGIYLDCAGASMGMASRQELIEAINEFKESGKWIVAYSDNYSQGDYTIATTADELYLNPMGAIDLHGVGGSVPFFKKTLDKLGIRMQIIKVGTFKSAVEPYILDKMSEPARLQMQQYCDTLWSYAAEQIAVNRNLPEDSIRTMASQLIYTRKSETFVSSNLVDRLLYRREVEDILRSKTGLKSDEDLNLVSPTKYASSTINNFIDTSNKHIAVYYATGSIVDSPSNNGETEIVGSVVVNDIIKLANDENVSGLVLRVNSPGGSAFASEQIWDAVNYFKQQNKPVYVSMGDYAASGGYYISCGADLIFADRTTITGSIGVFGMIPDMSGLITDKVGINFSKVETNPNAGGISFVEPMTPAQQLAMQRSVENIYDQFTSRVADGRHISQDSVKMIAEGRVWVGSKAIELGLVDHLGSLEETIKHMTYSLDLDDDDYIDYPTIEKNPWIELLINNSELDGFKGQLTSEFDEETLQTLRTIKRIRTANPIQARMETVIVSD